MIRRLRTLSFVLNCLVGVAGLAGAAGCSDEEDQPADAGRDAPGSTGDTRVDVPADSPADAPSQVDGADAGGGGDAASALVQRGSYLVGSVLGCGGCHTSRDTGAKPLAGARCWRDTMPTVDGKGCVHTPNLTDHPTGLKTRNDSQIKDLIRGGLRPDGKYLFSHMPSHLFANLTDGDADAIVAYLRTVTGVDNMLPANEDPWLDTMRPSSPALVPVKLSEPDAIPLVVPGTANTDSVARGRYLAALTCIECHTKPLADPSATRAFDVGLAYQGGRSFTVGGGMVYSVNLTPDATGLQGWSASDIVKVLKLSLDREGKRVCSPMRAYASMTDGDATDIANYLLALPAKANAIPMQCSMPVPTDGGADGGIDGGAMDSGTGDGGDAASGG